MKNFTDILNIVKALNLVDEDPHFFATDDNEIFCYINMNDVFYWGCADSEQFNPEDIPAYKEAFEDCKAIKAKWVTSILWAARKQNLRPQGAYLSGLEPAERALFQSLPSREIDLANPQDELGNYKYEKPQTTKII
jgi:hypothetical protein